MSYVQLRGVFLGLTITSTWGNGHATTYRALLKEFAALGHSVAFLERDVPWYANNRELTSLPYCQIGLYKTLDELKEVYGHLITEADFVVIGSYVPEGIAVGDWIINTAPGLKVFYDIDTPVTLSSLSAGKCEYLSRPLISKYSLYLSFTGGPTLTYLEERLHSPAARALYCSVDPSIYYPEQTAQLWDLAYLGTYAPDRQPGLDKLLLQVAAREANRTFAVAGPQYPDDIEWPVNILRIEHLAASEHRSFYSSQRMTLNLTRKDMVRSGYSPSVRLFEAAACGTPILSDVWPGLDSIFTIGQEILPVRVSDDVTSNLQLDAEVLDRIGNQGRTRVLRFHTAAVRARELEDHLVETLRRSAQGDQRRKVSFQSSEVTAAV